MTKYTSIYIAVLFTLIFNDSLSQENIKWCDSLAISFLRGKEFGGNIGIKRDTINGKIRLGKNYYCYESFRLKVDDTSSIFVVNLGAYDSGGDKYIAIIEKNKNIKIPFFLGEKKLEDDLEWLGYYFKSKGNKLKREYKIEIVDLFLRSKRGQIETPKYIH